MVDCRLKRCSIAALCSHLASTPDETFRNRCTTRATHSPGRGHVRGSKPTDLSRHRENVSQCFRSFHSCRSSWCSRCLQRPRRSPAMRNVVGAYLDLSRSCTRTRCPEDRLPLESERFG